MNRHLDRHLIWLWSVATGLVMFLGLGCNHQFPYAGSATGPELELGFTAQGQNVFLTVANPNTYPLRATIDCDTFIFRDVPIPARTVQQVLISSSDKECHANITVAVPEPSKPVPSKPAEPSHIERRTVPGLDV